MQNTTAYNDANGNAREKNAQNVENSENGHKRCGRVAIQQALYYEYHLSMRRVAELMHISQRSVWEHVSALPGSNVTPWPRRSREARAYAIECAARLVGCEHE